MFCSVVWSLARDISEQHIRSNHSAGSLKSRFKILHMKAECDFVMQIEVIQNYMLCY
jgi:hypothetical protein